MATAYIVAATPSSPMQKQIANLKSARAEADIRAKLDRVDVEVRTVATDKLTYTARGATTLGDPVTEFAAAVAEADAAEAAEDRDGGVQADTVDMSGFEAALAEVMGEGADGDEAEDQENGQGDEAGDHRGQASCGCSVEKIIATGAHQSGCADEEKDREAVKAVERDRPARQTRQRGGRRESQGQAAVDGWELLYDKPRQKAQVGRSAEGKYALICTTHKHAHPLQRLTQERGLRGGKRSAWCPECIG